MSEYLAMVVQWAGTHVYQGAVVLFVIGPCLLNGALKGVRK